MPRYFFDVIDGQGPMRDDEGQGLPTTEAARSAAAKLALDLAIDETPDQQVIHVTVNLRDDTDSNVLTAKLDLSTRWAE